MDYVIHSSDVTLDRNGRPVRMYDIGFSAWFVWTGAKFEAKTGPIIYVRLFKSIQNCIDSATTFVRVDGGKYDGYKGAFIPCTK